MRRGFEVAAPECDNFVVKFAWDLDDANVGRFTQLLQEFKHSTQFIVITHNPRTMQSGDAVYGVTMQEPGVSTIVGVRLGEKAVV